MILTKKNKIKIVCEINAQTIRAAAIRHHAKHNTHDILATAEVPSRGLKSSAFQNISELCECVFAALDKVTRSGGVSARQVTASLDDVFLESVKLTGTAAVDSQSHEFGLTHVREARQKALQTLHPLDKQLVYNKEAGFLVDRRDFIAEPLGICGKELTVVEHLLFSESARTQNLKHVIERAGWRLQVIYPAALAAFHGLVPHQDHAQRWIVILLYSDTCHVIVYEYNAIQEYMGFVIPSGTYQTADVEKIRTFVNTHYGIKKCRVLVTGERQGTQYEALYSYLSEIHAESPPTRFVGTALEDNKYAVLSGLYFKAIEEEGSRSHKSRIDDATFEIRHRIRAFIQDYF